MAILCILRQLITLPAPYSIVIGEYCLVDRQEEAWLLSIGEACLVFGGRVGYNKVPVGYWRLVITY
jgi:hypothetical protein